MDNSIQDLITRLAEIRTEREAIESLESQVKDELKALVAQLPEKKAHHGNYSVRIQSRTNWRWSEGIEGIQGKAALEELKKLMEEHGYVTKSESLVLTERQEKDKVQPMDGEKVKQEVVDFFTKRQTA